MPSVVVIAQDEPFEQPLVSIDDILSFSSYGEFLNHVLRQGAEPIPAIRAFARGRNKHLPDMVRRLRISGFDVSVYFLTPFALLGEEDLVVPYRQTLREMPLDRLRYLWEELGVIDALSQVLESEPHLVLFLLDGRLAHEARAPEIVPSNSLALIISEKVLPIAQRNVCAVTEHHLQQRLGPKFLDELARRLVMLEPQLASRSLTAQRLLTLLVRHEPSQEQTILKFVRLCGAETR